MSPPRRAGRLHEGMRAGDLDNLLLPLISVDEYESKIADEAIVFGFYVNDQDAAKDLNRFLQKSAVSLLDTEMSPAPDQRGYWLVFVELLNNARTADNFADLLAELEPLVAIKRWTMHVRRLPGLLPYSKSALNSALQKLAKLDRRRDEAAQVLHMLQRSDLTDASVDAAHHLVLPGYRFAVVAVGDPATVLAGHNLHESAVSLDLSSVSQGRRLADRLGHGWEVAVVDNHWLLTHPADAAGILLRPQD